VLYLALASLDASLIEGEDEDLQYGEVSSIAILGTAKTRRLLN